MNEMIHAQVLNGFVWFVYLIIIPLIILVLFLGVIRGVKDWRVRRGIKRLSFNQQDLLKQLRDARCEYWNSIVPSPELTRRYSMLLNESWAVIPHSLLLELGFREDYDTKKSIWRQWIIKLDEGTNKWETILEENIFNKEEVGKDCQAREWEKKRKKILN